MATRTHDAPSPTSPTDATIPRSLGLDAVAWQIEQHGVASVAAAQLELIARLAAGSGGPAVLAALLTDPDEPQVARERAFGRLAVHLARFERAGLGLAA